MNTELVSNAYKWQQLTGNLSNILDLPDEWPDDGNADDSGLEKFAETRRSAPLPSLQLQHALIATF